MQAKSVLCIRSGRRQCWHPVPVEGNGEQARVAISSHKSPWILRALSGKGRRATQDGVLVLKAFEKQVRRAYDTQGPARFGKPGLQPAGPAVSTKRKLLVDSDDETDDGLQPADVGDTQSSDVPRPKRNQKFQLYKLEVSGLEMVGFDKGPGWQLPAKPDSMLPLLKHLGVHFDTLLAEGRRKQPLRKSRRKVDRRICSEQLPRECAGTSLRRSMGRTRANSVMI